jgi:hypothetical protein
VKRSTSKGTVANDALRLRSIDDFPRFADLFSGGELFPVKRIKLSSSPNPFHENGLEG